MCRNDIEGLSSLLEELNEKGALPEVPEIIKERLEKDLCICGSRISENKSIEDFLRSQQYLHVTKGDLML